MRFLRNLFLTAFYLACSGNINGSRGSGVEAAGKGPGRLRDVVSISLTHLGRARWAVQASPPAASSQPCGIGVSGLSNAEANATNGREYMRWGCQDPRVRNGPRTALEAGFCGVVGCEAGCLLRQGKLAVWRD